jgi:hypothetical protein
MPAKVRRDPLSAATFSARPAASALKTTTTRAVRAVDTPQKVPKRRFSSRVRLFATNARTRRRRTGHAFTFLSD